jgi:hypothetical protein
MAELPHHPDSKDDAGMEPESRATKSSRGTYVVVALVIAAVLLMVILHLAGVVGAGSH